MLSKKVKEQFVTLDINDRNFMEPTPKYKMPEYSMPERVAYNIIRHELNLDGNPTLNLASFVTTEAEEESIKLMTENFNKNYVDQDEYPQTTEIQNRCINILADLFHAPEEKIATGTATIGSSEAIHLAGLALKWKWRKHQEAQHKPYDKPNIVYGKNAHVCWDKFARYFDVEARPIPLSKTHFILNIKEALKRVDENTIAVVGILGSTLSGEFENLKELNDVLEKLNKQKGWQVPIHIDAASGGFVAPFVYPDLEWDFRLPLVKSINVSGHKYGLVYPGLGWIIWRDKDELPKELIFHVNYLGHDEPTFNLNFSKGANTIIAQYYNFLRLGKAGYRQIMERLLKISHYITDQLIQMNAFNILSKKDALPVVCVALKGKHNFTVSNIPEKMRERGWIIPAYTMPPNAEEIEVLRIVIREGFNRDMADILIQDFKNTLNYFNTQVHITQKPKHKKAKKIM